MQYKNFTADLAQSSKDFRLWKDFSAYLSLVQEAKQALQEMAQS